MEKYLLPFEPVALACYCQRHIFLYLTDLLWPKSISSCLCALPVHQFCVLTTMIIVVDFSPWKVMRKLKFKTLWSLLPAVALLALNLSLTVLICAQEQSLPPLGYCGLPQWLSGKESAYNAGDGWSHGFDHWVKKIPWRRKWQPAISLNNPGYFLKITLVILKTN